jgi:ferritin-like metal-binding protein YciE
MATSANSTTKSANASEEKKPASRTKTTKSGTTRTVSRSKPAAEQRQKRAQTVKSKAQAAPARKSAAATEEKGLMDLFEHALRDIYYAEKKIYRSLPKMIKAADDEALTEALSNHRDETQGQIETLEEVFELLHLRVKGEKCDAIDGILEEADGILEDFGGTLAGDAAIIFSARAVEHYEICRYHAMIGFADALGLDEVLAKLQSIYDQESASDTLLTSLAEGSVNEAASEYDETDSQ